MAMVDSLGAFFRVGHIVAAIVWLGFTYFMAYIRPRVMGSLPEDTRRQVLPHLARYIGPWMMWSAIATIGFGAALYTTLGMQIGFQNIGIVLNLGALLALVMFVLGASFLLPFTFKVAKILEGGRPPSPAEVRRAGVVGHVNAGLSFVIVFLMVLSQRVPAFS